MRTLARQQASTTPSNSTMAKIEPEMANIVRIGTTWCWKYSLPLSNSELMTKAIMLRTLLGKNVVKGYVIKTATTTQLLTTFSCQHAIRIPTFNVYSMAAMHPWT